MPKKPAPRHARKKHARNKNLRRGALTLTAAATATTMAFAPITPAPKADAVALIMTTQIFDIKPLIETILGFTIPVPAPFQIVSPNPTALRNAMAAGGNDSGMFGLMDGAIAAGQAIKLLNASHPNGRFNFALIRNPGRANGGLAARFDWLYSAIWGQSSVSGTPLNDGDYHAFVYDFGAGWDMFSDFPSNINPVSIINSIAQAILPINLIGYPCPDCAQFTGPVDFIQQPTGGNGQPTLYVTLAPQWNALLYPLRIPQMISKITGISGSSIPIIGQLPIIGDPFKLLDDIANTYEPALDILINSGYNDVNTTTWTRNFQSFGTNSLFFFDNPFPVNVWLKAVQDAAFLAATRTPGLIQPMVDQIAAFSIDVFNQLVPIFQPIIDGGIAAVIDGIRQIIAAIISGAAVNPLTAASTAPTEPASEEAPDSAARRSAASATAAEVAAGSQAEESDGGTPTAAAEAATAADVAVAPEAAPGSSDESGTLATDDQTDDTTGQSADDQTDDTNDQAPDDQPDDTNPDDGTGTSTNTGTDTATGTAAATDTATGTSTGSGTDAEGTGAGTGSNDASDSSSSANAAA